MLIGKPKPQGYAVITDRQTGKAIKEADTYTCSHCQRIVHVPAGKKFEEIGDWCRGCMKVICARCADQRVCVTFLKKIEPQEDAAARANIRKRLGL